MDTKVDNSGYGKVDKHLSAVDPLTLPVPIQDEEKKIKLNFYFLTSLWYLKRFYEGLFAAPQRSVKIKI